MRVADEYKQYMLLSNRLCGLGGLGLGHQRRCRRPCPPPSLPINLQSLRRQVVAVQQGFMPQQMVLLQQHLWSGTPDVLFGPPPGFETSLLP